MPTNNNYFTYSNVVGGILGTRTSGHGGLRVGREVSASSHHLEKRYVLVLVSCVNGQLNKKRMQQGTSWLFIRIFLVDVVVSFSCCSTRLPCIAKQDLTETGEGVTAAIGRKENDRGVPVVERLVLVRGGAGRAGCCRQAILHEVEGTYVD